MREIPSELSVSVMNGEKAAPSRAGATPLILRDPGLPAAEGAYNPAHERDACGVGFVADMHDRRSHAIVQQGLKILENIDHRGAVGADPTMGDGCGILTQIPHGFFSEECSRLGFELPPAGQYAIGQFFLPKAEEARASIEAIVEKTLSDEGLPLLGWRDVPVDSADLGKAVKETEPHHRQVFIGCPASVADQDAFERRVYIARKVISNKVYGLEDERVKAFYPVSVSSRTIVYKGMVLVHQLGHYYLDLKDPRFVSALALVHQRFATNTFPTWRLSHPYRMVAHNGEINTLRGNVNWMAARQASVDSELFGNDISKLWPISYEGQSDTACFDNALEFLVAGGYSLAHAMMMLIPEAWAGNPLMSEERRAFYEYHAALMEPWDGPAAVAFTDGRQIGATLDRNGLRPARYIVTDDGLVVLASEMGVLPIPDEKIVQSWRLQPGRMLLIDLEKGRIVSDEEIKGELASAHPYAEWVKNTQIVLEDLHPIQPRASRTDVPLLDRQQAFGYTQEDLKLLMAPMAVTGQEAVGSMGSDTPLSALSDKPKLLYTYFKQNFAQVTNPPIDPIREEAVMSLVSFIGPRPNLLDMEGASRRKRLEVRQPILTNGDLEKIRSISHFEDRFDTRTLDITYAAESGAGAMEGALDRLCDRAEVAVRGGYNIIILSDRMVGPDRIPIPALLATAAVHNYLIRKGLRTSVGLVVESGEPREVHHFACLAGYGAEAINPYLAFETLIAMKGEFPPDLTDDEIVYRYIKSIDKGLLKVMSKMGISTYQSYCGAQIFDAIGLNSDFVAKDFFGTATTVEGIGMAEVAQETTLRHQDAFGDAPIYRNALDVGGEYAYRLRGETHTWTPDTVATLQHAVRLGAAERYREYARLVNEQENHLKTLRGLFRVKTAADLGRQPVDISAVEPASEIVKRFATGAMSYGSISKEAHETLAIAMNSFGGRSNSGEGGEEPRRFITGPDGRSRRSAIKQVASGRFGVTTEYLVNADMMQIKVSQGAKPGEGGQLPGHKVDAKIAKVRYATPGVGLISPPPHHDIYSIEDLAQLIFDLKNVNPAADVSVKLVSEVGVGTVAAGVAKARADHITISGFDGGTGAAPLTSIKHAGGPWETGLAETQQTLVMNGLRGRVALQADGGIRTGKDVMIAVLLGADQIGFSTAPLIAAGCIMMRKCHLNTCPVGVATQDPVLRKRFKGTPEHVINYFFFVAEELRELMAAMGFTKLEDLIGRSDLLDKRDAIEHWKARGLDFSKLFHRPNVGPEVAIRHVETQHHPIDTVLDRRLIAGAETAIETGEPVVLTDVIRNSDRAAGAMLSGAVAKRHGHDGLPDDTIVVKLNGTAGQSFGAWLAAGVTLDLTGHGNDYVGKGLSGGKLIIRPSDALKAPPARTIMAGNTVLYGAIAGECYIRGAAGERFAVRNSGAITVVEGMGDHGCEYMTGGVVVSIGVTGRNFAAGMSGGIAYVLDEDGSFRDRCNLSMVDLEPVEEEDDLMRRFHQDGDLETKGRVDILADMSGHDEERLSQLLTNHMKYTGSPKAKQILDEWAAFRTKFVKVMPVEYRRALREMEMARMPVAAE
ncbi:glutamate synthase large subunit [Methylorubrum extorquens]|uniref:Glutamate synthase [NADPH] large chain n=1 Tax=Methylorubrum extorquens (strain CM4 / NCIMB 13688) TaxID=440085 RepID=B7KVK2_METC4|nr:glutamate synthase large subunit [Methylorubrum extorquens]MDF9864487.1 glutamate synthase (NADPH/NADH) large chain [Methylorubrum pseudosasae]MDH6638076.1 glutamate synthase (NADPH/NADH) large chain [Methylobacterium sp. SuP10 SLI 274]MDH6667256.1 glutamate synthase (NADPH/NADH) large chain [Methylorubrum zatmanii]ACK84410.1 Glutamate synthase (ferredoxin) [Methylorubrum extorquens CM4]MCP1559159.1 glutamate synthase (NADPH/NADH) large chain [Methylorubrum extorquens]